MQPDRLCTSLLGIAIFTFLTTALRTNGIFVGNHPKHLDLLKLREKEAFIISRYTILAISRTYCTTLTR